MVKRLKKSSGVWIPGVRHISQPKFCCQNTTQILFSRAGQKFGVWVTESYHYIAEIPDHDDKPQQTEEIA